LYATLIESAEGDTLIASIGQDIIDRALQPEGNRLEEDYRSYLEDTNRQCSLWVCARREVLDFENDTVNDYVMFLPEYLREIQGIRLSETVFTRAESEVRVLFAKSESAKLGLQLVRDYAASPAFHEAVSNLTLNASVKEEELQINFDADAGWLQKLLGSSLPPIDPVARKGKPSASIEAPEYEIESIDEPMIGTNLVKVRVETPDNVLPQESILRGIWQDLRKRTKAGRLLVYYYVPEMDIAGRPWAVAKPDPKREGWAEIRTFETLLPEKDYRTPKPER
jgi:hypothetical protein